MNFFNSNVNWLRCIWFQHRIDFKLTQIDKIIIMPHVRSSNYPYMSTGFLLNKKLSLCKWITSVRLWFENWLSKSEFSTFFVNKTCPKKRSYVNFPPNLTEFLLIQKRKFTSQLSLRLFTICTLHIHMVPCELMILWNKTFYVP